MLLGPHYPPFLKPKAPSPNKVLTANTLIMFLKGFVTPRERVGEMWGLTRSLAVDSGTSVFPGLSKEGECIGLHLASGTVGSRGSKTHL